MKAKQDGGSMIRRFTDGRSHKGGIGMPAVTEHPEGEYVLYADYLACVAHNEMLLTLRKAADEKLAYALATIESLKARGAA